jgi:hypothetical protein
MKANLNFFKKHNWRVAGYGIGSLMKIVIVSSYRERRLTSQSEEVRKTGYCHSQVGIGSPGFVIVFLDGFIIPTTDGNRIPVLQKGSKVGTASKKES